MKERCFYYYSNNNIHIFWKNLIWSRFCSFNSSFFIISCLVWILYFYI